jgi:hypothetical protein
MKKKYEERLKKRRSLKKLSFVMKLKLKILKMVKSCLGIKDGKTGAETDENPEAPSSPNIIANK